MQNNFSTIQQKVEYLIKYPKNRKALDEALTHQKYLKFHIEGDMQYSNLMEQRMRNLLTEDKFKQFESLLYPSTTTLYNNIKRELYVIHNADGRKIEIKADEKNTTAFDIAEKQAFNGVSFNEFYRNSGWGLLFTEPNAVVVTDLPPLAVDELGQSVDSEGNVVEVNIPCNKVISLDEQHDICISEGVVDYFMAVKTVKYEDKEQKHYYYYGVDAFAYTVKEGDSIIFYTETPNPLGYTPCRTISTVQRFTDDSIQMASPASNSMYLANEYIEQSIMIKHNQLENGYAKTWVLPRKQSCGSSDCHDGQVYTGSKDSTGKDQYINCPSCKKLNEQSARLYGESFKLPDPALINSPEHARMFENPVGRLDADVNLLEWQDAKLLQLSNDIVRTCTGKTQSIENTNMAKNEMQVQSAYDDYENTALFWQKEVEQSWKFHLQAIVDYLYSGVECVVILGTKLYLKSAKEIEETEKIARENGAPNYVLADLRKDKLTTQYRNNPTMLGRLEILEALEPLKEYNTTQLQEMALFIPKEDIILKLNFVEFIERYEREYGVITAPDTDINRYISNIKSILENYGREKLGGIDTEEKNTEESERDAGTTSQN